MMRNILFLACVVGLAGAFVAPSRKSALSVNSGAQQSLPSFSPTALFEKRDASRSGTKTDRLNKLAELEDQRVETDKGFVLKAAGGFVGIIVVLLIAAAASGVLDGPTGY